MNPKDRHQYVPWEAMIRVEDIMKEQKIPTKVDGFIKMAHYSDIGREVEKVFNLDFGGLGHLPPAKPRRKHGKS